MWKFLERHSFRIVSGDVVSGTSSKRLMYVQFTSVFRDNYSKPVAINFSWRTQILLKSIVVKTVFRGVFRTLFKTNDGTFFAEIVASFLNKDPSYMFNRIRKIHLTLQKTNLRLLFIWKFSSLITWQLDQNRGARSVLHNSWSTSLFFWWMVQNISRETASVKCI